MRLRQLKRFGHSYRLQAELIADAWHIRIFRDGALVRDFEGPTEDEAERMIGAIELALDEAQRFVDSGCFEIDVDPAELATDDADEVRSDMDLTSGISRRQ